MVEVGRGPAKRVGLFWPFAQLNTRYRILAAAQHSAGAAALIGIAHLYTAAFTWWDYGPGHAAVSSDARVLASLQGLAGLIAMWMAVRSRRQPTVPLAVGMMVWALLEAVPWVPMAIYHHGVFGGIGGTYAVTLLYAAFTGLKGALALKDLPLYPPPPEGPLQLDR